MSESHIVTNSEHDDRDRILLVDDDPQDLDALYEVVSSMHDTLVEKSDDPIEALKTATSFLPDILITDLGMEPISGAELIERVDEELYKRVGRHPGVIVVTGKEYLLRQHQQLSQRAKIIDKGKADKEALFAAIESLNGHLTRKREQRKLRRERETLPAQSVSEANEETGYWLMYAPLGFAVLGAIIAFSPWLLSLNLHWVTKLFVISAGLVWVVVGLTAFREVQR